MLTVTSVSYQPIGHLEGRHGGLLLNDRVGPYRGVSVINIS